EWGQMVKAWLSSLDQDIQREIEELFSEGALTLSDQHYKDFKVLCDYSAEVRRSERGRNAAFVSLLRSCEDYVGDEEADLRTAAVTVMGIVADRMSVSTLIGALRSSDEGVVARAAVALGRIGDEGARPALEEVTTKG